MKRITASPWIRLHFATSRRRHWTLFILKGAWIFLILYLWSLLTSCHVQTVRQIDSNKGIWGFKKTVFKNRIVVIDRLFLTTEDCWQYLDTLSVCSSVRLPVCLFVWLVVCAAAEWESNSLPSLWQPTKYRLVSAACLLKHS